MGTLLSCDRELEADSSVQSSPRFTHLFETLAQCLPCHVPGDSFSRAPDPYLSRPWETFASFSPKSIHSSSSKHLVRGSSSRRRDVTKHFHLFISRESRWAGSQDPFPPTFSPLLLSSRGGCGFTCAATRKCRTLESSCMEEQPAPMTLCQSKIEA